MSNERLLELCAEKMATADVVYLTNISADGYPKTRAMLNLRNRTQYPNQAAIYADHAHDLMTYITTNTHSQKRGELEANARISLYFCHPSEFFGVCLIGDVEIVDDLHIKKALWVDDWAQYFPTGKVDDPDFTLLRLVPKEVRGWNRSETFAFELPS